MMEKRLRNVVVSGLGVKLRREGDLVSITANGPDGQRPERVSPRGLEQVVIAGEASITSGAIKLLVEHDVDLVFSDHRRDFFARVMRGDRNHFTELWRKQAEMGEGERLRIAREIAGCSVHNKRGFLYSLAKNRSVHFERELEQLKGVEDACRDAESREALFGLEGNAAKRYFGALKRIIPAEFKFEGREKRPPPDPMNAMLSYGYTVLLSRVEYSVMLAGLNPFEGVLHKSYGDRKAVGFDLMEEFRQPIVDRAVVTQISRRKVLAEEFTWKSDGCYMSGEARRNFLDALYDRMEAKYTYRAEKMEFQDVVTEQARKLADAIAGGKKYEGFRYR